MDGRVISHTFIPELGIPRRGKVRDIYELGDTLALVASDRISVFDRVLPEPIRDKGRVLTQLSRFWFDNTQDIIPNHLVSFPDPNVMIVKKCQPIMAEVIVRAYLVGSLWRDYHAGKRHKCGIPLPDGLKENDPLPQPIVTPTTKNIDGHDADITKEELIRQKIVTKKQWDQIESAALKLFQRGQEVVRKKGLILVDTKYEFGLDSKGAVVLIDEVHTPDSSRYWYQKDHAVKDFKFPDKEFAREWARSQGFLGNGPIPHIPEEIREKVRAGYCSVYETLTGRSLEKEENSAPQRLLSGLKKANLIKGSFALVLAGSEKDQAHVDKIVGTLKEHGIPHVSIVASAHKHPHQVMELIERYNESLEPVVFLTIAGRSNALSGVVAANVRWPVIACPPFKDYSDYLVNIHSSLQMPSQVPVMTVVDPVNAALAAARILKSMELTT